MDKKKNGEGEYWVPGRSAWRQKKTRRQNQNLICGTIIRDQDDEKRKQQKW